MSREPHDLVSALERRLLHAVLLGDRRRLEAAVPGFFVSFDLADFSAPVRARKSRVQKGQRAACFSSSRIYTHPVHPLRPSRSMRSKKAKQHRAEQVGLEKRVKQLERERVDILERVAQLEENQQELQEALYSLTLEVTQGTGPAAPAPLTTPSAPPVLVPPMLVDAPPPPPAPVQVDSSSEPEPEPRATPPTQTGRAPSRTPKRLSLRRPSLRDSQVDTPRPGGEGAKPRRRSSRFSGADYFSSALKAIRSGNFSLRATPTKKPKPRRDSGVRNDSSAWSTFKKLRDATRDTPSDASASSGWSSQGSADKENSSAKPGARTMRAAYDTLTREAAPPNSPSGSAAVRTLDLLDEEEEEEEEPQEEAPMLAPKPATGPALAAVAAA